MAELTVSEKFSENLECLVCYLILTLENEIYFLNCKDGDNIGACGHSFCKECAESCINKTCPTCRLPVISVVKNYTAIKIIEERYHVDQQLKEKIEAEKKHQEEINETKQKQKEMEEKLANLQKEVEKNRLEKEAAEKELVSIREKESQSSKKLEELNQLSQKQFQKMSSDLEKIKSEKDQIEMVIKRKDKELNELSNLREDENRKYSDLLQSQKREMESQKQLEEETISYSNTIQSNFIDEEILTQSTLDQKNSAISGGLVGAVYSWLTSNPSPLLRYIEDFKIQERRGSSLGTKVWRASYSENNKPDSVVALKQIKSKTSSGLTVTSFHESLVLAKISHPNIIKLKGIVANRVTGEYYMIFPFVEHDLDYIIRTCPNLNINLPMIQILSALFYLHSADLSHGDIKATSVIGSVKGKKYKLTSFSALRFNSPKPNPLPMDMIHYGWAPELLWGKDSKIDWKCADIWSAGCLFAQMISKNPSPIFSHNFARSIQSRSKSISNNNNHSTGLRPRITLNQKANLLKNILRVEECYPRGNIESYPDILRMQFSEVQIEDRNIKLKLKDILPTASAPQLNLLSKMIAFDTLNRSSAESLINNPYFKDIREQNHLTGCLIGSQIVESCIRPFLKEQCGFPL